MKSYSKWLNLNENSYDPLYKELQRHFEAIIHSTKNADQARQEVLNDVQNYLRNISDEWQQNNF